MPRIGDRRIHESAASSAAAAIDLPGFFPCYADVIKQMIAELADLWLTCPPATNMQIVVPDIRCGVFDECCQCIAAAPF